MDGPKKRRRASEKSRSHGKAPKLKKTQGEQEGLSGRHSRKVINCLESPGGNERKKKEEFNNS